MPASTPGCTKSGAPNLSPDRRGKVTLVGGYLCGHRMVFLQFLFSN